MFQAAIPLARTSTPVGQSRPQFGATHGPRVQAKLRISSPSDPLEQEADRVADAVLIGGVPSFGTSVPAVQRKCGACQSEDETLQRRAESGAVSTHGGLETSAAVTSRIQARRGGGSPLSAAQRGFFEPRFGYDFGAVRVHHDAEASSLARSIDAHAFTLGNDVYFGPGSYAPQSSAGQRLLAHELTHVVQQGQSHVTPGQAPISRGASQVARTAQPGGATTDAGAPDGAQNLQRVFAPNLSADPSTALIQLMTLVDGIQPSGSVAGMYSIVSNDQTLLMTQAERDRIRASARTGLSNSLRTVRNRMDSAREQYDAQHEINEDQWVVSGVVHLFGGIHDPGEEIAQDVYMATVNANIARVFIENGQLARAASFLSLSELSAQSAKRRSQAYVDNLISTAEFTVTVLEVTAAASAVAVVAIGAVLAAPLVMPTLLSVALATAPVAAVDTAAVAIPMTVATVAAVDTAAVAIPTTVAAVAAIDTAAVAIPTTVAAVAAPATVAAVAVPTTAAASTVSAASLATVGLSVASTTLASDQPAPGQESSDEEERKRPCNVGRYASLVCLSGEQAHHIVADYTLRYGNRVEGMAGNYRIPGLPSFADGPSICLSGYARSAGSEHNIAHSADAVIEALGAGGSPRGTAPISGISEIAILGAALARPDCISEIGVGVATQPALLGPTLGRTTLMPPSPRRWPPV